MRRLIVAVLLTALFAACGDSMETSRPLDETNEASAPRVTKTLARADVDDMIFNPSKAHLTLAMATFEPKFAEDKIIGFEVSKLDGPIAPEPNFFREIGLDNGDVLVKANKILLNTPSSFVEFIQAFHTNDVDLIVIRNGQQTHIAIKIMP